MKSDEFVHLHLHTEYSLLDGACRIDRLFQRAKELGQEAVAITDHGVMYGAIAFYKAAKEAGVRPIIGCEVYVAPRKMQDKDPSVDREYYHLVLLCENMTGYRNLIRLVSLSFTEGFYQKPRVDMDALRRHHDGLIALSGCLAGQIPNAILNGQPEEAERIALELEELFGKGSFYLELQDHGIPDQLRTNSALSSLSEKTKIPLVATNDVHYLCREDAKSHDVLLCIQTGKTLEDADRMRFETEEFYFKSTEEMAALFPRNPEAIRNSARIAKRCQVDFDFTDAHLPVFQNPLGLTSKEYLEKLCFEGLEKRFRENAIENRKDYYHRLKYELKTVEEMGFCDYFLIVADFVSFAKRNGIYVGPGRGSGAGSLAAWCLDITELDPIRFHLIFERFLNPERISMPDFDIDFCMNRRHEVIEYVTEKYGADHVAQIVTFSTMAARAAVRDVGRVMGLQYGEVDRIVKRIPRFLDMTLEKAIQSDPELQKICEQKETGELMRIAKSLEGMPRNASIHAAGVVLTDKAVTDYVPLAVNTGTKVTQYTMNEIADLGLLKIDFLGLRYLTIIRDAVDLIRKKNPDFDVHRIPEDDEETYQMISRGETAGMFQIESSGMKALMLQIKPKNLEDIMAGIALYRPGPKDSIPKFLENRKRKSSGSDLPQLQSILENTHGCIVYQEQVMQIFRELAGYSYGRADIVRRAMSKKKKDVMEKEREIFLYGKTDRDGSAACDGALQRGVPEEKARRIFDEMAGFAEYAFNKSHAAAYALLSYWTAYLKCKFPKEYMAAMLTSQLDSEKYAYYFSECQRMGIGILPPDINESTLSFSVHRDSLRFGFVGIKNVGEALIEGIFKERSRSPFLSFSDFVRRMRPLGLNKKATESLILSGAFDSFGHFRSQLFAAVDPLLDRTRDQERTVMPGQMSMFDTASSEESTVFQEEFPQIPEFSQTERLRGEKSICGVYLSGHPLKDYAALSHQLNADEILRFSVEPERFRDGDEVLLLCLLGHVTLKQIRSGDRMAFLQAEDTTGRCEVIVFPKILVQYRELLEEDRVVVIEGVINTKDEEIKILAKRILLPEDAKKSLDTKKKDAASLPKTDLAMREPDGKKCDENINFSAVNKLYLRFPEKGSKIEERAMALLRIFSGKVPCYFYYRDSGRHFRVNGISAGLNPAVVAELVALLGEENVVLK